jgi:hypothetical protein
MREEAMRLNACCLFIGLSATLLAGTVGARQALVRSYEDPAQVIGQAFLARYGDTCVALLPTHVAQEAGVPAFLGEGDGALGEAESVVDLGEDLGVARVSGNLAQDCGSSMSTISRAIDNLVTNQGLAALRMVNSEATLANLSVVVVDNDGRQFLRVRPTHAKAQIRKGNSGSLLMVGDRPVGMLLSVSAKHGVGTVLRLDALLERVETHLARQRGQGPAADRAGGRQAVTDLAAAENGGHIDGWNTLPVDSAHRPANLIAGGEAPPWRARVDQWPAQVELDLAGDRVVISRIELDARDVPKAERPGRLEILVSASSDGRSWRSLLSRDVEFDDDGIAIYTFAPTWARQVKLAIGNSNGAAGVISLRRVRISNP